MSGPMAAAFSMATLKNDEGRDAKGRFRTTGEAAAARFGKFLPRRYGVVDSRFRGKLW
jgi:hypothetical protein